MHTEVTKNIYPDRQMHKIDGIGETTGAMEEPALWLPFSPQVVRTLESEGYALVEQFTGQEELENGKQPINKSNKDFSPLTFTFEKAIESASYDGDIAVVSRVSDGICQFRQIWLRPNDSVAGIA